MKEYGERCLHVQKGDLPGICLEASFSVLCNKLGTSIWKVNADTELTQREAYLQQRHIT